MITGVAILSIADGISRANSIVMEQSWAVIAWNRQLPFWPCVKFSEHQTGCRFTGALSAAPRSHRKVKSLWHASRNDLFSLIDGSGIKRNPYNKTRLPAWLDEVHEWAASERNDGQICDKLIRFSQSTLTSATDAKRPCSRAFCVCSDWSIAW